MQKQLSTDIDTIRLLDLVRNRINDFRGGKVGNQFETEGFCFELVFARRNTVYRVRSENTWYVKIPSHGGSEKALREKSGAQAMKRVSNDVESCFPSCHVAVCPDQGIIVSSAIPGDPIQSQLYQRILAMPLRRNRSILDAYSNLGDVLAAFHGNATPNSQATTRPTAMEEFDAFVDYLPDTTEDRNLRTHFSEMELCPSAVGYIHGNLRRENILLTPDQKIGMIDFEDAGLGSRYDDISQICCAMLVTKTAIVFPWRPVYAALNAMLCGYHQRSPLCEETLLKYTAIRVATKLALLFTEKPQTIARIPVSLSKTRQLLNAILSAIEQKSLKLVDKRLSTQSEIAT